MRAKALTRVLDELAEFEIPLNPYYYAEPQGVIDNILPDSTKALRLISLVSLLMHKIDERLTVEYILNLFAHGAMVTAIIKEYKGLTQEDIQACFLFATKSLENTTFMPLLWLSLRHGFGLPVHKVSKSNSLSLWQITRSKHVRRN